MKRFVIVLALLNFAAMGWSQNFKKKNIQAVPHGVLKPIDMPELGVPIATQPLVGSSAVKTQPFLQKRSALLPQGLKVKTSDAGLPTMIEGTLPPQYAAQKSTEERVFQYLNALGKSIQISKPSEEFVIKSIETDDIGQTHVRLQQVLGKIPVWASQVVVHETNDKVTLFNGVYFPTPFHGNPIGSVSPLEPTVLNTEAEAFVKADLAKKTTFQNLKGVEEQIGGEQLRSELVIFHKDDNRNAERLAWHVVAYPSVVHRYEYFVDAQNGQILANCWGPSCRRSFRVRHSDRKSVV